MSITTEMVAHAHGTVDGLGVFTADNQVLCQISRFLPAAVFVVVMGTSMGSNSAASKVTFNARSAFGGASPIITTVVPIFDEVFILVCSDDAGNAIDPEELWVSIERVPRVA